MLYYWERKVESLETKMILLKATLNEVASSLLRAPLVYYTLGLKKVAQKIADEISVLAKVFALHITFRTMFQPLYGDFTRSGRIISFFVRLFLLFFRVIGFLLFILILGVVFVAYVLLPLAILYFLINPDVLSAWPIW